MVDSFVSKFDYRENTQIDGAMLSRNDVREPVSPALCLLGVDVEDWFHAENVQGICCREQWPGCESRIEANVDRVLALLEQAGVQATFFVLGLIAERYPKSVVTKIAQAGHEVASHGYDHRMLTTLKPIELREDLYRSKAILEDTIGKPVLGYRAPSFSITSGAVNTLGELGYVYDSSWNPVRASSRYGQLDSVNFERAGLILKAGSTFEIPMSKFSVLGLGLPMSGGGYFRLYPYVFFRFCLRFVLRSTGVFNFYLHPWELDTGFPKVRGLRWDLYFRHYVNLRRTEARLRQLLCDVSFRPLRDALPR